MTQNTVVTCFSGAKDGATGGVIYTRRVWPRALWQEERGVTAENRGIAPGDRLRVFVPEDTQVALGDKLLRGDVAELTPEAWTVTGILLRDFGSAAVHHKEVCCQ